MGYRIRFDRVIGCVLLACSPARAADVDCLIATVDEVAIRVADADALRGIVQPPPSSAAARRLAVDAAVAHRELRGWLAPSSARGRLEAWRAWLSLVEQDLSPEEAGGERLGEVAAERLARVGHRFGLVPGPCAETTEASIDAAGTARTFPQAPGVVERELVRHNRRAPVADMVELFVPRAGNAALDLPEWSESPDDLDRLAGLLEAAGLQVRVVQLGRIAPPQVEATFAEAAFGLPVGGTSAPFASPFGVHVVRVVARWEPGELAAVRVPAPPSTSD